MLVDPTLHDQPPEGSACICFAKRRQAVCPLFLKGLITFITQCVMVFVPMIRRVPIGIKIIYYSFFNNIFYL